MKIPALFSRKTLHLPSVFGFGVFGTVISVLFIGLILSVDPFLAPVQPAGNGALIIEGWVPDYCFDSLKTVLINGRYRYIFVTGGPLELGSYLSEYKNYALLGKKRLLKLSFPDSLIFTVPAPHSRIDRTWGSAIAFKRWLDSTRCAITTFDLVSLATHTRRSTLLFRRALGKRYRIGSIAISDPDYNFKSWWKSSKGFRITVDESIAYIYALFFIHFKQPDRSS